MKFGEKYELLESLTTGGVETFVANDKIRGHRVLVHILHCDAQKSNQPTVQWVLEAFRRVAPEPAGLVLETGRYSGTLYAYLITKLPEDTALQAWVRLYKAQARDTQEVPAPLAVPAPQSDAPTADVTSNEPLQAPGAMTQPFRDFGSHAKPGGPSTPSKEPDRPSPSLAKTVPNIGSPANSFSSTFTARNFPSETNAPTPKDSPRAGEFTSFFQGPFRAEGPSEIPAVSAPPMDSPRKTVGDFTAMFNSPFTEEPSPAPGLAGNEPAGTGFTGWFNSPEVASRTSGTAVPPSSSKLPPPLSDESSLFPAPTKDPFVPPQPASYIPPAPPIFPVPPLPTPTLEKHPVKPPIASPSSGATYAFSRPASEVPPSQPETASGPSAYTRIISVKPPAGPSGAQKEASPRIPAAPAFPVASLPSFPAPPVPPTFPMPPPPAIPKIAAPPAPKPPKAALPEPPASYWPLILTLTVLFFIAVLLVLYFVLKH